MEILIDNIPFSVEDFLNRDSDSVEILSTKGSLSTEILEKIYTLRLLREIQICDTNLSTAVLRKIASSLPWSNLRVLVLRNCQLGPRGAKTLAEFLQNTSLQHLDLSANDIQHFGSQAIGSVLPSTLETLNLSSNKMGFDGMWKASQNLSKLAQLKSINFSNNNISDDGALELAKHISHLNLLTEILLSQNDIGDTGFSVLAEQLNHPQLQLLNLSHNRIHTSIEKLQLSKNPNLLELILHHNKIDDDGCTHLAEALLPGAEESDDSEEDSEDEEEEEESKVETKSTSILHTLDLSFNQIGDEGAGSFVEHLDDIPSLAVLKLDGNQVSEARTRIFDMLLKHRTVTASNNLISPSRTVAHVPKTPTLPSVQLDDPTETEAEVDDDASLDNDAVEEGRDILASLSLDHQELSQLPMDYVNHLTSGFKNFVGYGTFGKLYKAEDSESALSDHHFLVRRLILSSAGPLESVRAKVLDDLAALKHDNCVPILAYSKNASVYVFLYDSFDTVTLRDCLASESEREKLSWSNRLSIMSGVAKALDFLHAGEGHSPTFHGDIRPDNILVSADRMNARLIDVGLSRLLATDRARFAPSDVVFGSRGYRCPRYERGSCAYDASSDMFSYGVVLAEVTTGILQRSGNKSMAHDVYYDVILARRPLNTDPKAGSVTKMIMDGVGKIVVSCLGASVGQRPSAHTVVQILNQ